MRNYYSLATFDDLKWSVQFGDYDKDVVKQEIVDSYSNYNKTDVIIIKSKDDRQAVDDEIAKLNKVTYSITVRTCAEYIREAGLPSLKYLEDVSSVQVRTLRNWFNDPDKQFVFDAIIEKAVNEIAIEKKALEASKKFNQ